MSDRKILAGTPPTNDLGGQDFVTTEPAATALLAAGQEVHVVRDGTGVASVTETIDMPVQTIQDDTLA